MLASQTLLNTFCHACRVYGLNRVLSLGCYFQTSNEKTTAWTEALFLKETTQWNIHVQVMCLKFYCCSEWLSPTSARSDTFIAPPADHLGFPCPRFTTSVITLGIESVSVCACMCVPIHVHGSKCPSVASDNDCVKVSGFCDMEDLMCNCVLWCAMMCLASRFIYMWGTLTDKSYKSCHSGSTFQRVLICIV